MTAMRVFTDFEGFNSVSPCAVALGFFDGVHVGHREVIRAAVENGIGLVPAVFTFFRHPVDCMGGSVELLTDLNERLKLFESLGVEITVAADFNLLRNLPAEDFFGQLVRRFHAQRVAFGYNYRFGTGGVGDTALLHGLCARSGITALEIPPVCMDGEPVSSSRIRACLCEGDVGEAAKLLGRPVCVSGTVVQGKQLGHKLGFATVNQLLPPDTAALRRGVYASCCTVDGRQYRAVTNIGSRPTVLQTAEAAETHLIDYRGDLYGRELTVRLLKFLRPQRRFEDISQLSDAIAADVKSALAADCGD